MKFWCLWLSASFFVMGSFGIGFLIGAAYGLWPGLGTFAVLMAFGIYLHKASDTIRKRVDRT
jgi:sulfite exporter TauE/SafE